MSETKGTAAPVLPWQEQEAAELRAELHLMKTAGIIEVAVRNPSVADYMAHWEGRALAAEARTQAAEQRVKDAVRGLEASSELINRLMHVHVAPDECTSYVEGSRKWLMENGGSLAAIAEQQAVNRSLMEKPE